jgi:hypothetical protein
MWENGILDAWRACYGADAEPAHEGLPATVNLDFFDGFGLE